MSLAIKSASLLHCTDKQWSVEVTDTKGVAYSYDPELRHAGPLCYAQARQLVARIKAAGRINTQYWLPSALLKGG
jgi:hypothetical protein